MVELKQPTPLESRPGAWSPDLLPLAEAPEQHPVLVDNQRVRVLEVVSPPGGIAPLHVHRWHSVFITVSPARLLFRDSAGDVALEAPGVRDGEVLPRIQWFGPGTAPRSVENVGSVELRAYRIELKGDP
jgi:hypothetical protein